MLGPTRWLLCTWPWGKQSVLSSTHHRSFLQSVSPSPYLATRYSLRPQQSPRAHPRSGCFQPPKQASTPLVARMARVDS
ncbi:hypothetical protein DB31_7556 [Hyalangium minutum]|uniref:Uncharacterized protein n=1 Tax=Hyalangium minutum TaxID=394096 RepID=A0A085WKV6_9BACT|nr:hypothetical protein DB31_7556 [Hyalangium minutum]